MSFKAFLPQRLRLECRRWIRKITDLHCGHRFAQPATEPVNFTESIQFFQPIRPGLLTANKVHNLRLASDLIRKVIVFPGETFSFWHVLGRPGKKSGYRKGRNLIAGNLVEGYGGGLCQLSGAIYFLSLLAGLEVIERHHHSVDIYREEERYAPLGADATVVYGYKDLRIGNNQDHPLNFLFEVSEGRIHCVLRSTQPLEKYDLQFARTDLDGSIEVHTWRNGKLLAESTYRKMIKV